MEYRRITLEPARHHANSGIVAHYPLEAAAWVWHPHVAHDETAVLRFTNDLTLDQPATTRIHLSADQRYELFVDGCRIGMGPDRAELNHWAFASYELELEAGEHRFEARVWWIGEKRPWAQVTERGAFVVTAEGLEDRLQTGRGPWRVQREHGWRFDPSMFRSFHVIGPGETIDGNVRRGDPDPPVEPVVVHPPLSRQPGEHHTGQVTSRWQLHPSVLPDMLYEPRQVGRVRAVIEGEGDQPVDPAACDSPAIDQWQPLFAEGRPVTVPPNRRLHVIVDLEDYYCGFTDLHVVDGDGSTVELQWAESLYEVRDGERSAFKGDRGAVAGKLWYGFGHRLVNGGGAEGLHYRSLWWTSGRYHRLSVTTADQPLTIRRAGLVETRFPYENAAQWRSSSAEIDAIVPIAVRGIQMCAHETYVDCPYYEQMMYVGDSRVQMLVAHVMSLDERLTRRGIELFDFSRWKTGFIAERCPSQPYQLSLTFSMIWPLMVHDCMMWRGDRRWVADRLAGIRCLIENFLPLRNDDGLLEALPGWSFVDWVPAWRGGVPADGLTGVSSIINLQFILMLRGAAAIERWCGEPLMADRDAALADRIGRRLVQRFWHAETGRLADDLAQQHFSEHAQALAILADVLDEDQTAAALNALENHDDLARATVYFAFYVLEALAKLGRGELVEQRLAFWQTLRELDMKTPVEKPEPSRSDCHAWGSHPLFHDHATLAGVRPDGPGFETVRIAPLPGSLTEIESDLPHPRGRVATKLRFDGRGGCEAEITLPSDTPGRFLWAGREHLLPAGRTTKLRA